MNDKHSGVRRCGQRRREQQELRLPSKMVKTPVILSSRPVRDLRECCGGDQSSLQLQRCTNTRSVVMTRTGAAVERASQAEDAQMPTCGDQQLRILFPSLELTMATCGGRAPEASDAPQDEVAGPDGVRTSSPVLCGRCSVDRWLFGHLCQAEGEQRAESRRVGKGAASWRLPTDGRAQGWRAGPLLAQVRAARAIAMVADVPLQSVHVQVRKEQCPQNGLVEGAVKKLKAKIRTLRHSTEMGLGEADPGDS